MIEMFGKIILQLDPVYFQASHIHIKPFFKKGFDSIIISESR